MRCGSDIIKPVIIHKSPIIRPQTISFATANIEDRVSWIMNNYLHQGAVFGKIYPGDFVHDTWPRSSGVYIDIYNGDSEYNVLVVPSDQMHLLTLDYTFPN